MASNTSVTKMEFAVRMTCQKCVDAVNNALEGKEGIKSFTVNLDNEQVIVETTLSTGKVQELLENSGRLTILRGLGASGTQVSHLGAAVAEMSCGSVLRVARFVQVSEDVCIIDGAVDGLTPGLHGLNIHELGDLSQGCFSTGDHYNPGNSRHGAPEDNERVYAYLPVYEKFQAKNNRSQNTLVLQESHSMFSKFLMHFAYSYLSQNLATIGVLKLHLILTTYIKLFFFMSEFQHVGDLGNILADKNGRAHFRMEDRNVKVWDVIGRSLVVHSREDDLGRGSNLLSQINGNSGPGLTCGIIARSAGLFQNSKKFCACDGKILWEDKPLYVPTRSPPSQL